MTPTVGSLFSGIGGMDLGLERAGFQVRWQVEHDAYCTRVLAKHWPDVQRYGDIRAVDWRSVEHVDLVCGGFPCQPVSQAGQRRAQDDDRWLWPEFARCLRELRPRLALVENVPGLLARGFGDVLGDLADLGFDAEWSTLSACSLGAPHRRTRVFVVAYPAGERREACLPEASFVGKDVLEEARRQTWSGYSGRSASGRIRLRPYARVLGVADGLPDRFHRLRGLGNAVLPQIAEWLGHRLHAVMSESA